MFKTEIVVFNDKFENEQLRLQIRGQFACYGLKRSDLREYHLYR